jgi:ribosomal protein L12E/L44/L45/RPP1/RPP2
MAAIPQHTELHAVHQSVERTAIQSILNRCTVQINEPRQWRNVDCTGHRIKEFMKTIEKTKIKIFLKVCVIYLMLAASAGQGNHLQCNLEHREEKRPKHENAKKVQDMRPAYSKTVTDSDSNNSGLLL